MLQVSTYSVAESWWWETERKEKNGLRLWLDTTRAPAARPLPAHSCVRLGAWCSVPAFLPAWLVVASPSISWLDQAGTEAEGAETTVMSQMGNEQGQGDPAEAPLPKAMIPASLGWVGRFHREMKHKAQENICFLLLGDGEHSAIKLK